MKIACISASQVPSGTANSIQAMKVCQSLAQTGQEVCLWLPGQAAAPWPALAEQYGLQTPFQVRWLPSRRALRRYDFAWGALRQAQDLIRLVARHRPAAIVPPPLLALTLVCLTPTGKPAVEIRL